MPATAKQQKKIDQGKVPSGWKIGLEEKLMPCLTCHRWKFCFWRGEDPGERGVCSSCFRKRRK
jgi:hypothetical protein